jgi:hypothetical protein
MSGIADSASAYPPRLRMLVLASGLASLIVASLYIYVLLYPQYFFSGYIQGYASLTGYELWYSTSGKAIYLSNLSVVKIVSLLTYLYVASLLGVSAASIFFLLLLRRPVLSASLAYGSALSLVVAMGVLRFLAQAFQADVNRILSLARGPGELLVYRTTAGVVEFIGVEARETLAHSLLFKQGILLQGALAAALVLSMSSIIWILYIQGRQERETPKLKSSEDSS